MKYTQIQAGAMSWKELVAKAEQESNIDKLRDYVLQAEDAIFERLPGLYEDSGLSEREEIQRALRELFRIKVQRLNYPPIDLPEGWA